MSGNVNVNLYGTSYKSAIPPGGTYAWPLRYEVAGEATISASCPDGSCLNAYLTCPAPGAGTPVVNADSFGTSSITVAVTGASQIVSSITVGTNIKPIHPTEVGFSTVMTFVTAQAAGDVKFAQSFY